jgi:hypothetical protein
MILIDKTFEIVTHESAEHGVIEDGGFSSIGERMTFRELVHALKREFIHASQSPVTRSTRVWFTTEPEQDYRTGEFRSDSIHFSPSNPPRKVKYWMKAMETAGYRISTDHSVFLNPSHPFTTNGEPTK